MNTSLRKGIAELFIGLAVCAGGYFMLVDPIEGRLKQVRERMDAIRADMKTDTDDGTTPEQAAAALKKSNERLTTLARRSQPARDQAVLLGDMMSLASQQNIRVEQLNPSAARPRASGEAAVKNDLHVNYMLNVEGAFADVVRFTDALSRTVGITQIRSVRIAPKSDTGSTSVLASIETEHFAADLSVAQEPKP